MAANQAALAQAAGQIIAQNQQAQSAAQAAVVAGNQEVKASIAAANGEATTLLAQAQQSLAANLANAKATDAQLDGQFQDSINQAKNTNSANASTVGTALATYENAVATRSAEQQQFTQAQLADFQQAQAQQKASWVQTDSQDFTSIAHTIVTDIESGAGWVWGHVTGWFGATVSWVENHPLNAALTGASLTPIAGNFIAATDDAFHGHWGWALVDVGFVALDCDGMGEAEAAARVAKDVAEDAVKAAAENAAKMEIHHLLPQQFAVFFERVGLDPQDYTMELSASDHRLKPNGIHVGLRPESWNGQWKQFFESHGLNYTKQDVLDQLANMKHEFGIK